MDKTILNGSKLRIYDQGNNQSGSIQYTDSKLSIKGNSAGSGVLITDGKLHLKSGTSTSSIIYDASTEGVQFPDGLVIIGSGSAPGVLKFQSSRLSIYTHSSVMGELYVQGLFTANGDMQALGDIYAQGDIITSGKITSSGAKIGSGTGYVSSSAGVYSTKAGQAVMYDLGQYRTITINGTSNEVSVSPTAQNLSTNRTWTIGLPDNVKISNNLTIGDNVASDVFSSGFGGSGFAISQSNNRYIAQFDDLWVRGSMNVHQFVINQIRATNGSLWVSDAAKAISASISGNYLYLYFESGSTLPFQVADIIRSKRWIITNDEISNWDIITVVDSIDYENFFLRISTNPANCYTASNQSLPNLLQAAGSQWVRIGNMIDNDREGGIYLTSGDNNSPYIDIYDGVQSIAQSHNQDSGSVRYDKLKVRLGKLQGVSLGEFDNMSGYGLYSDNVYLKGTISATAGTFSGKVTANEGSIGGWQINSDHIYKDLGYPYQQQGGYIKIGATTNNGFGYQIYTWGNNVKLGVNGGGNPEFILHNTNLDQYFKYQDSSIQIKTPNFTLSNAALTLTGSINATSGNFTGQVNAGSGTIGGWTISSNALAAAYQYWNVVISPTQISFFNYLYGDHLLIGTNSGYFNGSGIGYFINNDPLTPYFKVDKDGAFLSGSITASAGTIGGWSVGQNNLSQEQSIVLGSTSTVGASDIFIGSEDGSPYFQLGSKFKYTNSNIVMSGSISSSAGYIGGWIINDSNISSSGIALVSGDSPEINIGAESYGSNGIWLGKATSYKASFINGNNKILFDGTNIGITTSNFTLSNGAITSTAGTIGGWNINSGGISSTHSYGTISITKSGTSILTLTDIYGNFSYSAANSHMFTNKTNLYQVASASFTPTITKYESDLNITTANPDKGFGIQFTDWCQDPGTPLIAFTISNLDEGVQYTLQSKVINPKYTASLQNVSSLFFAITYVPHPDGDVIFSNTENPLWNRYSSENEILKQYKFSIPKGMGISNVYLWLMGTMRPYGVSVGSKPTFTFSGFRIDSSKQYTQLSQKGLLVYNTPQNYIQLVSENGSTTNSSQASLGLVNIETLYVNGISVNSALTTPRPVALGGTGTSSFAHRQFLWYDTQSGMITASGFSSSSGGSATYSHPEYTGVTLSNAYVISAISVNSAGTLVTASRALTAANIGAVATSRKVTGAGLLGGGGNLTTDRTITHNIANGAYHLPANGSAGQLITYASAGSGSWTSNIQTNGTASFASITASAGFTSSTGNIAVGGSITSSYTVKAMDFEASKEYRFSGVGSIQVNTAHGTALDLQDFSSLKIGNSNNYGTSTNTFLQGYLNEASGNNIHIQGGRNQASGNIIHIQGYNNSGSGEIIHIEGSDNRAEVNYGHTQGYNAIGHITGSKTFANGSMDGEFPQSTTQVSTIVLYAYNLIYDNRPLINQFYSTGVIDFNRAGVVIDHLHISFFLNVMITYGSGRFAYAYQQTFTYNNDRNLLEINTGAPYGDVFATAGIRPGDLGDLELVQDQIGMIHFLYTPRGHEEINSVIVKVEMIEHIAYINKK